MTKQEIPTPLSEAHEQDMMRLCVSWEQRARNSWAFARSLERKLVSIPIKNAPEIEKVNEYITKLEKEAASYHRILQRLSAWKVLLDAVWVEDNSKCLTELSDEIDELLKQPAVAGGQAT